MSSTAFRSRPFSALVALAAIALAPPPAAAHPDPAAQKVAILIFDNVQVIDYSGPLEVLSDAGFDVFTVAATKDQVTTSAGDAVKLTPKYSFADAPQADLLVIPGGGFEAARDSATAAWIKRQSEHAAHTMSVCNGAFSLANAGLLDGQRATTTAGNINRLRRNFPQIRVTPEQRVIDNGRIVTTAGLSAGIDGALHMVDVMKGEGSGKSVALDIEYDWRPDGRFVRGIMADRLLPAVYGYMHARDVSDPFDSSNSGDDTHWDRAVWYKTSRTTAELFALLRAAFEQGYSGDGAPWLPGSVRLQLAGPQSATLGLEDREGHHWEGVLAMEPRSEPDQVGWRISIKRLG